MVTTDTREKIMSVGRLMVQGHGYNALSFREIGKEVGVSSASIHHHFPTKGDLGAALAQRYTEDGIEALGQIIASSRTARDCIDSYAGIFRAALLNDNRMCLVGLMAAEHDDLPVEVRAEVDRFINVNVEWLVEVLSRRRTRAGKEANRQQALAIFAAMEGAQLVARGRGNIALFDQAVAAYRAAGLFP
ncbi:TetR family transcriptional regulator [Caballeronia sordidicola]|uniref:TetR family transcriptional regulator n=1 Tax=Caballeronia sordidicola TaxID=196367 RepID=A0A158FN32_CABSO|nr:TetR/AcrR family transcriptional regulator [Caballeronia sordidicola]SAL21053.1 TetR family transcriptional regulator [Caballeronia sordidicola]